MTASPETPLSKSSRTTGREKPRVVGSYLDSDTLLLGKQLGAYVKHRRLAAGMSRTALTKQTGVSASTIKWWEDDGYVISLPHLVVVSRYFNMTVYAFIYAAVQHWKENGHAT